MSERKYPRRFKGVCKNFNEDVDYLEVRYPGAVITSILKLGGGESLSNSEMFADKCIAEGAWIETFDHHAAPQSSEPDELAALRLQLAELQANCKVYEQTAIEAGRLRREAEAKLDAATVKLRMSEQERNAVQNLFYEKYREAGLPEGGIVIDIIHAFAELKRERERSEARRVHVASLAAKLKAAGVQA